MRFTTITRNGFTLVEMLVAIVVASILTIGMVNIFRAQNQAQNVQNRGVERTMNARAALDMIAREVRNAGYDPRGASGAGFVITEPTDVEWTSDLNSDGDTDDAEESVRYYLDAEAGTILRASGGVTAVVADNIQGLTFTYLDAALAVADEDDEIRHVNIAVDYETPGGVMVGALETQVAIRNRIFQVCAALPTILIDGDFEVSGDPDILGCGKSLHANGDLKISGDVTASGSVSTSGDLDMSGGAGVQNPDGEEVTVAEDASNVSVPTHSNPTSSHCDDADYTLTHQGKVIVESTGQELDATSVEHYGWRRTSSSPVIWTYENDTAYPGTFCVDGSAKVSGDPGKDDASPVSMTIIAKGSIEVTGSPHLTGNDPSGYLLLAGGDVKITGSPLGAKTDYDGIIYAYSQCEVHKLKISGQLMCADKPTPGHAKELTNKNKIQDKVEITSDCSGGC